MKFDWYQASIPDAKPSHLMNVISSSEYFGSWQESAPLKGYHSGAHFLVGDQVHYRLSFGGSNEAYGPNILGSGASAPKLAQVLRESFPVHRVSRVDACQDYYHLDAYDYIRNKALQVAKRQKVQVREIVKPLVESDDGRTLYLGSSSTTQVRVYEKGKQLGLDHAWTRGECQLRPQKAAKDLAAHLAPVEVWAVSKWTHALAVDLGKSDLKRISPQIYQQSDHDRAYRFMLKQYRNVFDRMKASHGSWDTVGAQIGYDLEHLYDQPDLMPPEAS